MWDGMGGGWSGCVGWVVWDGVGVRWSGCDGWSGCGMEWAC